ncbi:unnamed protein product [Nesidiocoris tenuis]|uniref:Uncharacterized protein n=1 Tax=Nesidiocoris tenuis TaxID=355587 RepID=A0A6H5GEE6_9HEMI|nr:unnamed protein product [Nesidiocoris tenuis]
MSSSAPRQKIIDMSNTAAPTGSDCEMRTPCAWGVYVPFTRQFDYYMKNTSTGKVQLFNHERR